MLINELNRFINTGKVLFVGINYDKDERKITEWEKWGFYRFYFKQNVMEYYCLRFDFWGIIAADCKTSAISDAKSLRGVSSKKLNKKLKQFFNTFKQENTLENSWYNEYIAYNSELSDAFDNIANNAKIKVAKRWLVPQFLCLVVGFLVGAFVFYLISSKWSILFVSLLTSIIVSVIACFVAYVYIKVVNDIISEKISVSLEQQLYKIENELHTKLIIPHPNNITASDMVARMKQDGSDAEKLYILLTSDIQYRTGKYEQIDLHEGMALVKKNVNGWGKPRFLLNHNSKCAYAFMDDDEKMLTVTHDDIDWESIKELPDYAINVAKKLSGHYPTIIHNFENGFASVSWQLHPSGYYYMDEDGFGMTDDIEMEIYGTIDTQGKVVK